MSEPRTFLREVCRLIWGDGWPGDLEDVTFEALEKRPRHDGFIRGWIEPRAKAVDALYQQRITDLLNHNTELVLKHREEKAQHAKELEEAVNAWKQWSDHCKRLEETARLATALTIKERKAHEEDRRNDWHMIRRTHVKIAEFLRLIEPMILNEDTVKMRALGILEAIARHGTDCDALYGTGDEKEESNGTS